MTENTEPKATESTQETTAEEPAAEKPRVEDHTFKNDLVPVLVMGLYSPNIEHVAPLTSNLARMRKAAKKLFDNEVLGMFNIVQSAEELARCLDQAFHLQLAHPKLIVVDLTLPNVANWEKVMDAHIMTSSQDTQVVFIADNEQNTNSFAFISECLLRCGQPGLHTETTKTVSPQFLNTMGKRCRRLHQRIYDGQILVVRKSTVYTPRVRPFSDKKVGWNVTALLEMLKKARFCLNSWVATRQFLNESRNARDTRIASRLIQQEESNGLPEELQLGTVLGNLPLSIGMSLQEAKEHLARVAMEEYGRCGTSEA